MKFPGVTSQSDIAQCKQAHWFTHSRDTLPISSFRESYFREILKAMIPLNNDTDNVPMLNEPTLKKHVHAEYDTMKS